MICKKCGAQIEDNSIECKFCGASYETTEPIKEEPAEITPPVDEVPGIVKDESDTEDMFDENEIKRQRQIEKIRAEKQSQLDEIERRRKEKKAKQKMTRFLVILLALLCLGGAAIGGYYLFDGDNQEPEVVIVTETPAETEMPTEVAVETEVPTELPTEAATESVAWEAIENPDTSANNNSQAVSNGVTSNKTSQESSNTVKSTPKPTAKPSANTVKPNNNVSSNTKPTTSTATMGGTEYNAEGGMTDSNFTAALVTGGEIVKSGDRTYMSFKHDGSTYYAKVSSNTTTNFIAGKAMTLSAYKISETYNGVNVYEITAITHYNGTYVFPDSGFRLLSESDLAGKSDWELRVGRNEIYARHGRKFKDSALQQYFESCSWYRVKSSYDYRNDANNLNAIEKANANLIKKYEDAH